MRRIKLFTAAIVVALAFGTSAQAGTFDPGQSVLGFGIGALPPITTAGIGGSASFDGTTLTDSAGIWLTTGSVGTTLFTGVPLISNLFFTGVGNASGLVNTTLSAADQDNNTALAGVFVSGNLQGSEALTGQVVISALSGFAMIPVPLTKAGVGGVINTSLGAYPITVIAGGFGTQATITGITTTTPNGAVLNSVSQSGGVTTTVGGNQIVTLVAPIRTLTGSLAGALPGFATKTFVFVPEPGTLLLLGSGIAGLAFVARRRR